jgi:hypothetical protein
MHVCVCICVCACERLQLREMSCDNTLRPAASQYRVARAPLIAALVEHAHTTCTPHAHHIQTIRCIAQAASTLRRYSHVGGNEHVGVVRGGHREPPPPSPPCQASIFGLRVYLPLLHLLHGREKRACAEPVVQAAGKMLPHHVGGACCLPPLLHRPHMGGRDCGKHRPGRSSSGCGKHQQQIFQKTQRGSTLDGVAVVVMAEGLRCLHLPTGGTAPCQRT